MNEKNLDMQGRMFFENIKLKKQVAELEKKLNEYELLKSKELKAEHTKIIEIMRQKDKKLEDYALELEDKNEKLQKLVEELQKKNAELETWVTVLKLYQDIFQADESAMIEIDSERNIIQFNKAAVNFFGSQMEGSLFHPIESTGIEDFCPQVSSYLDKVFNEKNPLEVKFSKDNCEYFLKIYPLMSGDTIRGVMLKIRK